MQIFQEFTLGTPTQPTPFKPIPLDGNLTYNNFTITFLVDENLENYLELHNWMRALGVLIVSQKEDNLKQKIQN